LLAASNKEIFFHEKDAGGGGACSSESGTRNPLKDSFFSVEEISTLKVESVIRSSIHH
jgi:hypothetical protein